MKKALWLFAALALVLACGQEEPADDAADTTTDETTEVADTVETAEIPVEDTPPSVVTAWHILVCYDGCAVDQPFNRTQEEAQESIRDLQQRIQSGEMTFVQAAIEYSDCPSGQDGGMLGEFGRGAMVPAFEEAAFALPVGGMSDVVETQFGYHLILREQ
jgi:hypothetical protein